MSIELEMIVTAWILSRMDVTLLQPQQETFKIDRNREQSPITITITKFHRSTKYSLRLIIAFMMK
jgi:hypothetical protein